MKKIFILFFALITSAVSMFASVEINGIAYNLNTTDLTAEVTKKTEKYSGDVVIPAKVVLNDTVYSVTSIGNDAFENCIDLTYISISNSVTNIGKRSFYSCSGLTSITIPNSVTRIGSYAFSGCSGLTSVSIPNSVVDIEEYAFVYCSSLISVTIPKNLERLQYGSFIICSSLVSINVEEENSNYCSVDGVLFNKDKTKLIIYPGGKQDTEYIIPNSVTSIGSQSFQKCSGLKSVTIPSSVTSIGSSAFSACKGLTSINVDVSNPNYCSADGVLFNKDKTELITYPAGKQGTTYTIPNSVTEIGYEAFESNYDLTYVSIPNSVIRINNYAFRYCSGLTYITIPNSVTSIGDNAFDNLKWMKCESINPPAITSGSFSWRSKAIPIYVPAESIDAYKAANYWKDFTNIKAIPETSPWILASGTCGIEGDNLTWEVNSDNILTISGSGEMKNYQISDSVPWYSLRETIRIASLPQGIINIGQNAFFYCSGLTSVTIPNSVTSIGNSAFSWCSRLTSVTIPYGVTRIVSSFEHCTRLTSVIIPTSVTSIENYAFSYCSGLISVSIPSSVTSIYSRAFGNCSSLNSINVEEYNPNYCSVEGVLFNKDKTTLIIYPAGKQGTYTIPNSVTSIGNDAFSYCSGLISVSIPNSVTSIGNSAFFSCSGLTSVSIPNKVTSIGNSAFSYCSGLTSVTIFDGVTSIGNSAFYSCSGLTSVSIPNSVLSIGNSAFGNCSSLNSINVEEYNTNYCSVEGVLFNKNKTTLITYPAGKQGTYNIPDSVTSIGNSAFSYCSGLTSVTIPNSVTYIQAIAFYNCSNLTSFTCKAVTPPSIENNNAFYNVDKSIPVYVPAESIEAYKAANVWKEFTNIQAIAGFDPEHPANPGSYQLTLVVEDTNKGYTTGSGLYEQGATAHIEAIARDGYQFVCWSDNDSNAVRDIVIIRDSTLTASFTEALGDDTVYVDFPKDLDDLPIGKNTNVIITPYGRLNITRPIAIKSLMIEKDTAFGQVSGVDMLQAESVEVMHYFYRHIDEGSYRWFAFSVPFTVSVAEGIFMNEAHDVARYGVDFVIDEYDGHLRATMQEGWKRVAANATLYPGKFYMIASKQANIWYFKALDPSTAFDAEPFAQITAYSSAIGDHHAGWNGIANKQFVNANLQATTIQYATTYNNYYGVYSVMPLTNYMTERPGMPFFVQASEHDTIEFRAQPEPLYTDGGIGDPIPADAPSRLRRAHESRPFVLSIGNSEYTDKAYVDLAADKEDRYTIGEDLIKMQTSKPTVPQIWINAYDAHLAAYAMPAESEKSAIELGISTPQEGTYTLSFYNVPQGMTMFISKDGEHLYPLSNGEYEIYLEKGVNTNYRIEIYRTPSIYTDIENINSSKGHCKKMIKDGKLYLLYEGTMYNVQGVKVIDK